MNLAIFDLDNTLIAGDSDYLWGQFLTEIGAVDGDSFRREHDRYYADYLEGNLDIDAFLRFQLAPLARHPLDRLHAWRTRFVTEKIRPILLPRAQALLDEHRSAGHALLIITATNRFITQPIAHLMGVDDLIATDPEFRDGRFTGEVAGIPSYAAGKVERFRLWMIERDAKLKETWFYSDSHNDLPLLDRVSHAVAVDPDERLRRTALARGWSVISLR